MSERTDFPIQARSRKHPTERGSINRSLHMAAYEVYSALWDPQEALLEGDCRGGFHVSEMIALLYARGFPQDEWRMRFHEATLHMDIY